jgi:tetratricopeptide (TPR) repeat protein
VKQPRRGLDEVVTTFVVVLLLVVFACVRTSPGLEEIAEPGALAQMETSVREQYLTRRSQLDRALLDGAATREDLVDALGELGHWYQAHEDFEPAEACYRNAEKLAPGDFRWPYFLGHILIRQDGREEAREKFLRVLALDSNSVPTLVTLAELELEEGSSARAADLFQRALEVDPRCARALYGLGHAALERGNYAGAVEFLEAALGEQAEATSIHYALGMAYRGYGDLEKASLYLGKARIQGNEERVPLEMTDPLLEQVNQLKRDHRTSRIQQAEKLFQEGRYPEASEEIHRAIAATGETSDLRFLLGLVLHRMRKIDEAIVETRAALRLRPEYASAHYQLGLLLVMQGHDGEAETHFQEAVAIDPGLRNAYFRLGILLQQHQRCPEAVSAYEKAIELDASNFLARFGQAVCLLRLQRWGEAEQVVTQGLKIVPQAHALRHLYARMLATSPSAELRDGQRALELAVSPGTHVQQIETLAMAYAELGNFDEAIRWQRSALEAVKKEGKGRTNWIEERLALYLARKPCRQIWGEGERKSLSNLLPAASLKASVLRRGGFP